MSQHQGSSILSSDNPQAKYKKALKEISKLINANKVIRQECEETRRHMDEQMNELAIRYNHLQTENHQLKKERESLEKYFEELQESHSQLQKQHHTTEKQLTYLNEMIAEQNAELKKHQAFRDQKKITQLIRTYEDKEQEYISQMLRNQDLIKKLKQQLQQKDNQSLHFRNLKDELEEKYIILSNQIIKYKQLNNVLISRNQKIHKEFYTKEGHSKDKQTQINSIIQDFKKQITSLKTAKENITQTIGNHYQTSYQLLLQEKNRIIIQYAQLKDNYISAQNKIKHIYELQEKVKAAVSKSEQLAEECNMLKSKIVVLQSKDIMEEGIDFTTNQKDLDEKINSLLIQTDPLATIKNSDDSSHFKILRGYIIELRQKMQKVNSERKQYIKKYKSISSKHAAIIQQLTIYQQQNNLLKGKVEGFQKLTQKLQNQLEKNLVMHQQQINRMNNLISQLIYKNNIELQSASNLFRQQKQILQDKFSKTQKSLKQQVDSLKLQLDSYKLQKQELQKNNLQMSSFINIYKIKFNEINNSYNEAQTTNLGQSETINLLKQSLKDQKCRNDHLNNNKNQLIGKISELKTQYDRKVIWYQDQIRHIHQNYDIENKRSKTQNLRLKQQLQLCKKQLLDLRREFEEKRSKDNLQIQQLARQSNYYKDIEIQFNKQKQKYRELENQNQTIKLKNAKYMQQNQRLVEIQQQFMKKNDECNDLTRKIINLQSSINQLQLSLNDEKLQSQNCRKEASNYRLQLLQKSQQVRKQIDLKDQQTRNSLLTLSEQVSDLNMKLNQQKSKNLRLNSDNHQYKITNQKLQANYIQLKQKQNKFINEISSLNNKYLSSIQQNQNIKSEFRLHQLTIKRLNQQIQALQKQIGTYIQDVSALKIKQQDSLNAKSQILRQIDFLKFYFPDVQQYVSKIKNKPQSGWQQQRVCTNIFQIILRLKKLSKGSQNIRELPLFQLNTPGTQKKLQKSIPGPEVTNPFSLSQIKTKTNSNKNVMINPSPITKYSTNFALLLEKHERQQQGNINLQTLNTSSKQSFIDYSKSYFKGYGESSGKANQAEQ